jgi:glycosidase
VGISRLDVVLHSSQSSSFVNGDPTNDNANGTAFEQDILNNQLRHGGDIAGLLDSLDYLQGMGIRGLYVAGSPFLNQPWTADSYSPVDLTILDHHFGTLSDWRNVITEIHKRGMYVVLDNTFATMGDLLGFEGFLNTTTPFELNEHRVEWKSERRYLDFAPSNDYNSSCHYPRFWNETGYPIDAKYTEHMIGCYNSDFDQYGDTEAFGVFPDYQRQLSKYVPTDSSRFIARRSDTTLNFSTRYTEENSRRGTQCSRGAVSILRENKQFHLNQQRLKLMWLNCRASGKLAVYFN